MDEREDWTMDKREARLPAWARELIASLRMRVETKNEPLLTEVVRLRSRAELLERENAALKELFLCAAKGGHMTCQDIVQVFEAYSLTLTKD